MCAVDLAIWFVKFIILGVNRIVNRARTEFTRHPDLSTQIVLFAAAFVLYWRTMPPTVLDGDSGEFQYMASILGVPHSSGYPL